MRSLQFKRLVLVSDTTKSGNQFKFGDRYNLITGRNNSIGKSTLAKSLFWALGCDPEFDVNWKSLDCKALLEFSVGDQSFTVVRANDAVVFGTKTGGFRRYPRITGEYSEAIAALVGFKALLPNRADVPELETPPPAYYFLPFYIDQLRSWTAPWNSFDNLGQYASWKATIVKYHTGYLSAEHFELEQAIYGYRDTKIAADEEIKRINTALEVVETYVPKNNLAITAEEFNEITLEVDQELGELAQRQETLLDTLTKNQTLRHHLANQLALAEHALREMAEDYKFSVEYVDGDSIECPLCGTLHDNSLVSRATILSDQQQAEDQVQALRMRIAGLHSEIDVSQKELSAVRKRISEINSKYRRVANDGTETVNLVSLVDSFASRSVQRNVELTRVEKQSAAKEAADRQSKLKKEQTRLLNKQAKNELGDMFIGFLSEFLQTLNAKEINLSGVRHPTDYNKIFGSGGAAEGTRAVLAYQLAVFKQIYAVANEVPAPLVIDTPNQQEQAGHNYDRIVKLILEGTPGSSQIIMCAMQNERLAPYSAGANVIELNEDKLLGKSLYEELSEELHGIMASASL